MSIADAVQTYILAKDGNRPLLMRRAFAEACELVMHVNTDAISFPSAAKGLNEVSDILVSRFAVDYENIYTFCLSKPAASEREHFACRWLVGMSAKRDGAVRVGCGRYDWRFGGDLRATKLTIEIETMAVLPNSALAQVFDWLTSLPYPWCSSDQAARNVPPLAGLNEIRTFLQGPSRCL